MSGVLRRWLVVVLLLLPVCTWAAETPAADPTHGDATAAAAELADAKRAMAQAEERIIAERKALGERLATLARESARQEREFADLTTALAAPLPDDKTPMRGELARYAAGLANRPPATPLSDSLATWRSALEQHLHKATTVMREDAAVTWWDGSSRTTSVLHLGTIGSAVSMPIPALVVPLGSGWRQAGPLIDEPVKEGWIPVDVTGKLIGQTTIPHPTLYMRLREGGWFVVPILCAGLIALMLVLERLYSLQRESGDAQLGRQAIDLVGRGDLSAARQLVEKVGTPTARVLSAGLQAFERGFEARAAALGEAILAETPRVERSLTILGMLAAISPLLGLLGTVSGMIAMFQVLSAHGTGNPKLLSGGISEALITTQLGLLVAVPVLFAHALLVRRAERTLTRIEEQATALASLHGGTSPVGAVAGAPHV